MAWRGPHQQESHWRSSASALPRPFSYYPSSSSNILAYQLATPRCLEPAAYIMHRRGQLMRRIIAKHPFAHATIMRILGLCKDERIMGITLGEWTSAPPACPPPTYGKRSKWTKQAHEVAGPVGIFCTSLAEHRATTSTDLVIESWPTLKLHLLH